MRQEVKAWHGICDLRFINRHPSHSLRPYTIHQATCKAPFKLLRSSRDLDGRCEIPILHTAGGIVGGDLLTLNVTVEKGASCHITSVAAQKVYGSVGRTKAFPKGQWAKQSSYFRISEGSDMEWMPQEVVVFADGLFEQKFQVDLSPLATFLSADVVRLGRTATGETLNSGCWRSSIEISRELSNGKLWEFVDRLELTGEALSSKHGMANNPVLGSLVWVAPNSLSRNELGNLLTACREDRLGLEGFMSCSAIGHGISARYVGSSTQAARFWFFRIWRHIRELRGLTKPAPLRIWPIQENPFIESFLNQTDKR